MTFKSTRSFRNPLRLQNDKLELENNSYNVLGSQGPVGRPFRRIRSYDRLWRGRGWWWITNYWIKPMPGVSLSACRMQEEWRGEVVHLSWSPRAFLLKGFLTDKECDHLIKLVRVVSGSPRRFRCWVAYLICSSDNVCPWYAPLMHHWC